MRPLEMSKDPFVGFDADVSIEVQLQQMMDTMAIQRLKTAFVTSCDPYDPKGFAGLFTEDGVYTSADYGTHTGRAAIETFIDGVRKELIWTHHILTNGDIHLEDNGLNAKGRWYLYALEDVLLEDGTIAGYEVFAEYNDTFQKRDGRWYFTEVHPTAHVARRVNDGWRQKPDG